MTTQRVRILIYEGPEEWLETTLASSLQGVAEMGPGKTITAYDVPDSVNVVIQAPIPGEAAPAIPEEMQGSCPRHGLVTGHLIDSPDSRTSLKNAPYYRCPAPGCWHVVRSVHA